MRHYVRAVARARQRNRAEFERELAALRRIRERTDFQPMIAQGVPAPDLLRLAEAVARGRFAYESRRYGEAANHYAAAVAIEDQLPYMEPPFWYYPVRQSLGAALYQARRYDEARAAFLGAIRRSPENGWALWGLAATERALGHRPEAAAADAALRRAWLGDRRWLRMERL
jgi:tetratricopeptide (TPR) repeat protein